MTMSQWCLYDVALRPSGLVLVAGGITSTTEKMSCHTKSDSLKGMQ